MATSNDSQDFRYYFVLLSAAMIFVFSLENLNPNIADALSLGMSTLPQQPWSIVSYIFVHANLSHIFSNLFAFIIFGFILEKIVGSRNFIIIFFVTGIAAGIASLFFYPSVIGASGAIFGVMGAIVAIRPKMTVLAFGVPLPMVAAVVLWAALDLGGVFYPSDVANIGHLGGLAAGIAIGLVLRPKYKLAEKKKDEMKFDEEYFKEWEKKYIEKKNYLMLKKRLFATGATALYPCSSLSS